MPLVILGEGYRVFSEPRFFETESVAQVRQIEWPVDKAFALMADDLGANDLVIYKFNAASAAVDDGSTVLQPLNPAFDSVGRWLEVPIGGGGGGGGTGNFIGEGSPENVVTADPGARYWDTLNGANYIKETGAGNTGWLQTYTL